MATNTTREFRDAIECGCRVAKGDESRCEEAFKQFIQDDRCIHKLITRGKEIRAKLLTADRH